MSHEEMVKFLPFKHGLIIGTELKAYDKAKVILFHFSLTVKAATLIFISGCGSAISSAKEGKSGLIYNLVKG